MSGALVHYKTQTLLETKIIYGLVYLGSKGPADFVAGAKEHR